MKCKRVTAIVMISTISTSLFTVRCWSNSRDKEKDKAYAIVNRYSYLVGGTVNGKWSSAQKTTRYLHGGEHYRLYSDNSYRGTAVGSKPDNYFITLNPEMNAPIAIGGKWNALPRKPRYMATNQKTYLSAVRSVVKQQGLIGKTTVSIKRLIKVDIEGDGVDEVIICAHSDDWDYINYKPGQYSVVLLRKLVNERVQTSVVSIGMYRVKKPMDIPLFYNIDGVWDLDGDGKMEIVVGYTAAPYESYGTMIYGVKGSKPFLLTAVRPNLDFKVNVKEVK